MRSGDEQTFEVRVTWSRSPNNIRHISTDYVRAANPDPAEWLKEATIFMLDKVRAYQQLGRKIHGFEVRQQ